MDEGYDQALPQNWLPEHNEVSLTATRTPDNYPTFSQDDAARSALSTPVAFALTSPTIFTLIGGYALGDAIAGTAGGVAGAVLLTAAYLALLVGTVKAIVSR